MSGRIDGNLVTFGGQASSCPEPVSAATSSTATSSRALPPARRSRRHRQEGNWTDSGFFPSSAPLSSGLRRHLLADPRGSFYCCPRGPPTPRFPCRRGAVRRRSRSASGLHRLPIADLRRCDHAGRPAARDRLSPRPCHSPHRLRDLRLGPRPGDREAAARANRRLPGRPRDPPRLALLPVLGLLVGFAAIVFGLGLIGAAIGAARSGPEEAPAPRAAS